MRFANAAGREHKHVRIKIGLKWAGVGLAGRQVRDRDWDYDGPNA
jgi:hypothetical protein